MYQKLKKATSHLSRQIENDTPRPVVETDLKVSDYFLGKLNR